MAASAAARKGKAPATGGGGLLETLQRFWLKTYAGDYLGLIIVLVAYLLIQMLQDPFHQMFSLDDRRLQHPHADIERVSVLELFIYAGLVPLATLLIWSAVFRLSVHQAHVTVLGLGISIFLTIFLTDIVKNAVGRPRPDLIARCKPEITAPQHELVTIAVCTETNSHLLQDGWRSFPSGHSSFAFSGLGYLAMFFASQTHAITPHASLAVSLLCLAPLIGAALIAMSRLEDYRHDVGDVACGSLLGLLVAYMNWRRYYPSLFSRSCAEPFSPPTSGRASPNGGAFSRVRDEEEALGGDASRYSIGDEGESYGRDT